MIFRFTNPGVFFFSLALLLFSQIGWAGICHPFSEFGQDIARCEDNLALSESAMNCVEDYEKDVENGQAKIKRLLAAQVAKTKSQQNDTYDRSSASYQEMQAELKLPAARPRGINRASRELFPLEKAQLAHP
jgi:hypothetical protein